MKRNLTDAALRKIKPKETAYKVADGGGLYVYVTKAGTISWRYDYKHESKWATLTLGQYPALSLTEARKMHEAARESLAKGIKPGSGGENQSAAKKRFSDYAKQLLETQELAPATHAKKLMRMENYLFTPLDKRDVTQITAVDLLNILKPIAEKGARETAIRVAGYAKQTFDILLSLQLITVNPAESVARLLPRPPPSVPMTHITDADKLGEVLRALDEPRPRGDYSVTLALRLAPLVFLRPANIRSLTWDMVDFEARLITIPAEAMKMNRIHKIPMSNQIMSILQEAHTLYGHGELVFPGRTGAMSENTLNQRLRAVAGEGVITGHGFRHTASTLLNERGYPSDAVEMQLAHVDKDRVRATYNKAEWLPERTRMMQEWCDFLDSLKAGQRSNVIPMRKVA